jgi:hypothetical protein
MVMPGSIENQSDNNKENGLTNRSIGASDQSRLEASGSGMGMDVPEGPKELRNTAEGSRECLNPCVPSVVQWKTNEQ